MVDRVGDQAADRQGERVGDVDAVHYPAQVGPQIGLDARQKRVDDAAIDETTNDIRLMFTIACHVLA
ncbi:MAG: hypothetical protein AAFX92_02725 [Pseudomonadota bacterium]